MRVFGIIIMARGEEHERLKLRPHARQIRAVVAAKTKKEAIEKLGITATEARDHLGETGNDQEITTALSKPGQVFAAALDDYSANRTFIEIERTPHVPIPRVKRASITEIMERRAEREFTDEELRYLVDMFTGANNPVAASIAKKASLQLS